MICRHIAVALLALSSVSFAEPPAASADWSKVTPRLASIIKDGVDSLPEEGLAALQTDLKSILREVANRRGVVIQDAMATPDGLPALLPGLLRASGVTLEPRDREALAQVLEAYAERWNAMEKTLEGRTPLQRRADLAALAQSLDKDLADRIDLQHTLLAASALLHCRMAVGAGRRVTEAKRELRAAALRNAWMTELGLDPKHTEKVLAIAATFVEEFDRMIDTRRRDADPIEALREGLAPQIRAQEALLALTLAEGERKAVLAWETVDLVLVDSGMIEIQPPGDERPGFGGGIRGRTPKKEDDLDAGEHVEGPDGKK